MQLADVLMGALNYHLRMKSGTIDGAVVAKRKIVDKIQRWISTPLEQGTSLAEQKVQSFLYPSSKVSALMFNLMKKYPELLELSGSEQDNWASLSRVFKP